MTRYAATMNTPGYLPWDDEPPPVFDSSSDAWAYLAGERRNQEESAAAVPDGEPYPELFSGTVDDLDSYAVTDFGEGTLYGCTPGYAGNHDLGIAYSVTAAES